MSMRHARYSSTRRQGKLSDWQIYRRLLAYVSSYWYFFLFSLLGYLVYSAGTVLLADMMQFLLDSLGEPTEAPGGMVSKAAHGILDDSGMSQLEFARIAVPAAIVVLTLTRALGFFAGSYFMNHVARHLVHELRCELFDKMLIAPSAYYDRHSQGVLISKITFNVEQVTGAATKALKIILRESLTVIGLFGYMLYLNWRLCLVFLAVAPLIALVVRVVGKHFRRYSRRIQASMGDVSQVTNESVGAYREVRIFGGQSQQKQRFRQASEYNRVQSLKLAFADALSTPVIQGLLALALATLVWYALEPSILSGFSAGSLVAFLIAAGQLGKPIRQLSGVQSIIQRGLAASEDIFAQLDLEDERDSGSHEVARVAGDIEIQHLSFTYPQAEEPALRDFTLHLQRGTTVALVGRSGSGKSTLVRLLARFYAPDQGKILLDGKNINEYRLDNLRSHLAMVSQEVTLFNDTVYNNIAFGALAELPKERVYEAADAACATEFIDRLPRGMDTLLGDDGGGLSGGQRQRIAIARAILKDAPVLILDEATSALDNESEYQVQQAIDHIMRDRTTIVIAHRLSTVERADRIIVLDRGAVIASGKHDELLEHGGLYAQLYQQGFSG